MAEKHKRPVIVAELGRPETAAETASRKAEQSRLYKQRKTVNNLVFSLLVSVALMVVIVLIVPRGTDQWSDFEVNVAEAAAQNEANAARPLIAPDVPETWKAKQALIRSEKGTDILYWYIGYTTENHAFAAVTQAFTKGGEAVNDTWIGQQLEAQQPTGSETIGGLEWTVYDHPKRNADESNVIFALQTQVGNNTLLVYGTDRPEVLRTLAADIAAQAKTLGLDQSDAVPSHTDSAASDNEKEAA